MPDKSQLGAVLLRMQYVTEADLEEAFRKQKNGHSGKKIGVILVQMGKLCPEDLDNALQVQESLRSETPMPGLLGILESHVARYSQSVSKVVFQAELVSRKLG